MKNLKQIIKIFKLFKAELLTSLAEESKNFLKTLEFYKGRLTIKDIEISRLIELNAKNGQKDALFTTVHDSQKNLLNLANNEIFQLKANIDELNKKVLRSSSDQVTKNSLDKLLFLTIINYFLIFLLDFLLLRYSF